MAFQSKRIDQIINQALKLGRKDNAVTLTASRNGLTIDKDLLMNGYRILVDDAPNVDTAVANKKYVDDTVGAIDPTVALSDDGTLKGNVNAINVVDNGANVKATVTVSGQTATITMAHGTPSGGTATTNTGANVIANVTKTADGHITNIASVEVTPALIGAQPAADALTSVAAATAGVVVKTDENTVAAREIEGGNGVTVTNGNGVDGNPTIAVADGTVDAKGIVQLENAASDSTTTAATPAAVKAVGSAAVQKAGDTMTGALVLSGDPTQANHAATKAYVDAIAQGLNIHEAVRVATTEAVTLSGLQTIDGVELAEGDRVLVKNQANSAEDGVYIAGAAAWTRAADCDDASELTSFYVFVLEGDTYGGFGYNQTTTVGTVGTTEQTWEIFNKPAEFTVSAGNAIEVTQDGRVYSVAAKAASTTAAGVVQLNDTTNSASTSQAATANAVKTVKDAVDALDAKTMDLVASATLNNIALFDANGQVKDSGVGILSGSMDGAPSTDLVSDKQVRDYFESEFAHSNAVHANVYWLTGEQDTSEVNGQGTEITLLDDDSRAIPIPSDSVIDRIVINVKEKFGDSMYGDSYIQVYVGGVLVADIEDADLQTPAVYEITSGVAAGGAVTGNLAVSAGPEGRSGSARIYVHYHNA